MHPSNSTASDPATTAAALRRDAAFLQIDSMALEASEAAGFQGTHACRLLTALTHSPLLKQQSMCDHDFSFVLRLRGWVYRFSNPL
jgi:hypothetical protein